MHKYHIFLILKVFKSFAMCVAYCLPVSYSVRSLSFYPFVVRLVATVTITTTQTTHSYFHIVNWIVHLFILFCCLVIYRSLILALNCVILPAMPSHAFNFNVSNDSTGFFSSYRCCCCLRHFRLRKLYVCISIWLFNSSKFQHLKIRLLNEDGRIAYRT